MSPKLIVFVRAPRAGEVKTRLAQGIGSDAAAVAYATMVERLLGNLQPLTQVELKYTPDNAGAELNKWLQPTWKLAPQGAGDLGKKLARAFQESFHAGAGPVVVIGSDCPAVSAQDIQLAWDSLVTHDLVLGPARDGGYWLIGLRRFESSLFDEIPWSTAAVLSVTLRRARAAGLSIDCLRTLRDIDTAADWKEFERAYPPSG